MILVLGSSGMLGHKMVERLQLYLPGVKGVSRIDGFHAECLNEARIIIKAHKPKVVINCIGIIKQRPQDIEESIRINALFPNFLERTCNELGVHLIHFSTDCVFSGKKGGYTEADTPDPEDDYGRTKALGEVTNTALTLRTSIIGRERNNHKGLLEWFLRESCMVSIKGYENAIFTGVTTNWLADAVANLIVTKNLFTGLYQVAAPPISKCRLLRIFDEVYNKGAWIQSAAEPRCDRSLIGTKFEQKAGIVTPSLDILVRMQKEQDKGSGYDL